MIENLKQVYGFDLDATASHNMVEELTDGVDP